MEQEKPRLSPWRWVWRTLVGLVLLLVIVLTLSLLWIDPIVHTLANRLMPRYLSAGGTLEGIDIQVGSGVVEITGLTIRAPAGFGKEPLLRLGTLRLDVDPLALVRGGIVVEQLAVEELALVVVRNKRGQLSPIQVLLPLQRDAGSAKPADKPGPSAVASIRVKDLSLEKVSLHVLDHRSGQAWHARLGIDLHAENIQLGDMARQEIQIGGLRFDLHDLTIDQPQGYGKGPLASLDRLAVEADGLDLAAPAIAVKTIAFEKPAASLIVGPDKVTNLQKLKAGLLGPAASVENKKVSNKKKSAGIENGFALPVVRFDTLSIENGALHYLDNALAEETLALPLEKLHLLVRGLGLFDKDPRAEPASVDGSFELKQPGALPPALFGAAAVVGPVNQMPPVNAQIRFVGFNLDTLGDLVPPATRTALGATGLDTKLALALSGGRINLFAGVLTDHDVKYNAFNVHGPLDEPVIEVADIFSGAFDRISDGLVNLGGGTVKAGASIIKGGVSTVGEIGEGFWDVGMNLGESAFEVGKGLLTLDGTELREGLAGATRDTVSIAAGSLGDTGSAAGGGLSKSVSDLSGDDRVKAWEKSIPARYQMVMKQAREALARMPYPPQVP